jgi:hypothetical protein
MLMLPALSRLMQLHSHKVIGEIIIAVSANLKKNANNIRQKSNRYENFATYEGNWA